MTDAHFRFKIAERYLIQAVYLFASFLFVILFVRFFVVAPGRVSGVSMEPNFDNNNLFLINKMVYLWRQPQRFDVVQIVEPEKNALIIKRIIGLPGEEIEIKRGHVFLKKHDSSEFEQLDELKFLNEYVYTKVASSNGPARYTLKNNEYFVLGDNRGNSNDSRGFGSIGRNKIVGKVWWKF